MQGLGGNTTTADKRPYLGSFDHAYIHSMDLA